MNKKISMFFVVLGILLLGIGSFLSFTGKNDNSDLVPAIEDAENGILDYLYSRYGDVFNVLEHTTAFCVVQNTSNNTYEYDFKCDDSSIRNDIYKVSDNNGLVFYVKKVTLKDDLKLIKSLEKSQSNLYYDNYLSYISARNFSNEIKGTFDIIGEISSVEVVEGLGIERPVITKDDDGFVSYYLYGELNDDYISSANKHISLNDYLIIFRKIKKDNSVELKVKINKDLDLDGLYELMNIIKDNNFVVYSHGIMAKSVVFEFNNSMYVKFSSDYSLNIYKEYDYLDESKSILSYPKTITFYYMTGDNLITYDEFLTIDKGEIYFN
jgi:hypothetical protein